MTGTPIGLQSAKKNGYIDMVVQPLGPGLKPPTEISMQFLKNVAINYVKKLAQNPKKSKPFSIAQKPLYLATLFASEKMLDIKTNGLYPAPYKILQVI